MQSGQLSLGTARDFIHISELRNHTERQTNKGRAKYMMRRRVLGKKNGVTKPPAQERWWCVGGRVPAYGGVIGSIEATALYGYRTAELRPSG